MDAQDTNIDPDGTPISRFINDAIMELLQKTPNPDKWPEPDEHQRAQVILGALVSVNAGVIANILADPADGHQTLQVITQLAGQTFDEINRLMPQIEAHRRPN